MVSDKRLSFTWVDWLLLAAIAGVSLQLSAMLLAPAWEAWKNRPRPGMQVPQQYLVEQGSGANATKIPVSYLLYLPSDYTSQKKWPLVVYLHGAGARGNDLELVRREWPPGQVTQGKQFGFILLSPQCPEGLYWTPPLAVELIEYISNSLSVDQDRVYLTGYSMGGYGTWATASYDPGRFAAIAPLCGVGDVKQAERLMDIPIWAFHGDKDDVVPIQATEEMVAAVKKFGGHVRFTVYPGAGHGISGMTYENEQFFKWLLAQRRGQVVEGDE